MRALIRSLEAISPGKKGAMPLFLANLLIVLYDLQLAAQHLFYR